MIKKLIFFDIDGTLVTGQNRIPKSTKKAIAKLQTHEVLPIIATGRPLMMVKDIAKQLGIDTYIVMNGQMMVYRTRIVSKNPLEKSVVNRFMDFAAKRGEGVIIYSRDGLISNSLVSLAKRSTIYSVLKTLAHFIPNHLQLAIFRRLIRRPPRPSSYANVDVYQLVVEASREAQKDYEEAFGDELSFTRANESTMDVVAKGMSKAQGVKFFCDLLNVPLEDTYAFGDGLNDVEMLQIVGTGVAMGNAFPETKAVADYVTSSVNNNGIEEGLKYLGFIQ